MPYDTRVAIGMMKEALAATTPALAAERDAATEALVSAVCDVARAAGCDVLADPEKKGRRVMMPGATTSFLTITPGTDGVRLRRNVNGSALDLDRPKIIFDWSLGIWVAESGLTQETPTPGEFPPRPSAVAVVVKAIVDVLPSLLE